MSIAPERIAPLLLAWFDANGRKDLPWQQARSAYRTWISEVMLQQTQVATVKPYFARFMARFPEVNTLAEAPQDEVLCLWAGLGYYARGRNLHRAAQVIVQSHGGCIPESFDALVALPGIGRSTAGAILALAHGQRHPILDGNVKRVLARAFGVEAPPASAAGARRLWELALACTPHNRVADYTQAIMDLGATVCTPARPSCACCPLRRICVARATGRVEALPARRIRRARPLRHSVLVLALWNRCVLLERRPPRGIWGGLWVPPEFPDAATARGWIRSRLAAKDRSVRRLPAFRHAFTHFDLELEPWLVAASPGPAQVAAEGTRWHELGAVREVGLPAPVARLLEETLHGTNRPVRPARPRGGRPRAAAVPG